MRFQRSSGDTKMLRGLHLALLFFTAVCSVLNESPAQAGDRIECSCLFAQKSGYTAVGTRAVCSAMTHKNINGSGEA